MLEFITFGKNCAPSIWDVGNSEQLECFFFSRILRGYAFYLFI